MLPRTTQVIRFLRTVARKRAPRRVGRVPRPNPPTAIALEYFKAIQFVPAACARELGRVREQLLELVRLEREAEDRIAAAARHDAPTERSRRARQLVRETYTAVVDELRPQALHDVAAKFGRRVSEHQRAQLDRQVRAAVGVSLSDVDVRTVDRIPMFAKSNVELVKSVAVEFHDRLAREVQEAFETGMHPETLAKRFVELDGMTENDARRVARDQIGKLNAQFTQDRQEALGVDGYYWRDANDNRVRENHRALSGQRFLWDDPPMGGGTDETEEGHPGEGILCRCWAEPDFSDLVASLE